MPIGNPEGQGEPQGNRPELQGDRKSLPDQFGDREVLVLERGTEITVRQGAHVTRVLYPHGLIQAVGALQVRHDFGRQGLLLVKGTARSDADEKESERDNDEQRGDCPAQTLEKVADHRGESID